MANAPVNVGSKLYNVYYGPMTVVGFYTFGSDNTKVICCTIDDYESLSAKYKMLYDLTPGMNAESPDFNNKKYVKWLESSLGKDVFTNPKDATDSSCDNSHGYFGGTDKSPRSYGESAVGVQATTNEESAVGVAKISIYPGESGVGIVR